MIPHALAFLGGRSRPQVDFIGQSATNSSGALQSFPAQDIGAAASTRLVIVGIHAQRAGSANPAVTAVTIGGVSAVIAVQKSSADPRNITGIAHLLVPAGNSADIDVTFSASVDECRVAIFRGVNQISSTPTATASDDSPSGNPNTTIDIAAGGYLVMIVTNQAELSTMALIGATEVYDAAAGAFRVAGGRNSNLNAETARPISANGGNGESTLSAAAWA